jgi:uncharacterized cupin superfamily protein
MPAHLDDIGAEAIERGPLRGTRWRLGAAAGATRVGLSRYVMAPGERAMPVHLHADEEEIVVVLAGSGFSWQDGRLYPLRAGDAVVHRAGAEAHTVLAGAGESLDILIFGSGSDTGLTWLPRAGTFWAGPHWVPPDGPAPFDAEAAAGPLELPEPETTRPASIVALADVEEEQFGRGDVRSLWRTLPDAAGSARSGVSHVRVEPGRLSTPPHCHSADEELFVVLGGGGELLLGDDPPRPVRPWSIVARPAATGVAHTFRAGPDGLELLAYGTREPGDACFYPRSGKVWLRGLGAMFRVEPVDYWDGEA